METEAQESPFVLQLEDLIACIEGRRNAADLLAHSWHAIAVVRAIYASGASGREETVTP
ncbi:hypothetical protein [Cohnella ginsengisoli]|uniref:hypothetical protein n=1 Tax=Cohnella ginsengisoli TaxID=425004 RepID=UPI00240596D2|nr:hypothetical protein [Cohnella ginsengisoli]